VGTDEVYGDRDGLPPADEATAFAPSSPYAASKAAADLCCFAWARTYGLPVTVSAGCNTYGPRQHPEKLLPRVLANALEGRPIPLYGDGRQQRDWIHVSDHCAAICRILTEAGDNTRWNCGADCLLSNRALAERLCTLLRARIGGEPAGLITTAPDRPGHDRRYALDCKRLRQELDWRTQVDLTDGLAATVDWYLSERDWLLARA
ncbi:MAG: dTDP-glucose 4,6-dehydratase, partial [Planctomycetota bacterium]